LVAIKLAGATALDLRQYASEKGWGISQRQLFRYAQEADRLIAQAQVKDREQLMALHVARRESLYARCVSHSDHSNARCILKDLAELQGLYPAKRAEPTPLEVLLAGLDPRIADLVRQALAATIPAGGDPPGGAGNRADA